MDEMGVFARTITENKGYAHLKASGRREEWPEVAERVAFNVVAPFIPDLAPRVRKLIEERKLMPGGRYLYASGRAYPQVNSCFLFRAADSRDGPCGWADTVGKCVNALMTGGGIGVVYSDLRQEGASIRGLGGCSTGPLALMRMVNECARYVRQGGSRRSAVWAGLRWNHPDIFKFIMLKDWDEITVEGRRRDFNFPAPMDTTNVSIILDDLFFEAYNDRSHPLYNLACDVYWEAVRHMLRTGEPGFSVNVGENAGEELRNACLAGDTLVAVADGRGAVPIKDLVGTSTPVYAANKDGGVVTATMRNVRVTRRMAELLKITLSDGGELRVTPDHLVMLSSGKFAQAWTLTLGNNLAAYQSGKASLGERAVVALGSGGWEDVFDGEVEGPHCFAVVTDRASGNGLIVHNCTEVTSRDDSDMCNLASINLARIRSRDEFFEVMDQGVDPALVEDSLTLAEDIERRMSFQAWLQGHVDHGVSSTINLPPWGSSLNNPATVTQFGNTLLNYLPRLRGITAYPDGARGGQPLTRMSYHDAISRVGVSFLDGSEEQCPSGVCGV
jgi:ribonucleoside-diphosphate reductase alpha chain